MYSERLRPLGLFVFQGLFSSDSAIQERNSSTRPRDQVSVNIFGRVFILKLRCFWWICDAYRLYFFRVFEKARHVISLFENISHFHFLDRFHKKTSHPS